MMRRTRAFLRRPMMACAAVLFVSGCVTGADPESEKFGKAWGQILGSSHAVPLGSGRLRVEASTPFSQSLSVLEYTALARAAGEAVAAGAPRFAIIYADYDGDPLGSLLVPEVEVSEAVWIGSYEDLLEQRNLNDLTGTLGERFGYRDLVLVVRMLEAEEEFDRPAFDTHEIYAAMMAERIERKNIKPRRRLRVPFL